MQELSQNLLISAPREHISWKIYQGNQLPSSSHKMKKHLRTQFSTILSPNNPRGYKGKFSSPGLRPGVLSGEGVDREVAAFLID
jgi:hypothetical protein